MSTQHQPQPFTRTVGWGEALHLEIHYRSRGIKPIVEAIHRAVGVGVGTRNTFAKLTDLADAPVDEKNRWRAWLLLTALGQEPATWHIGDDVVPAGYDVDRLRDLVRAASGWPSQTPAYALAS